MSRQSWGLPSEPSGNDNCKAACDEACATVQQLSRAELENLMEDSAALNRLIHDLEKVKNLSKEKDGLLVSNASLAEYNLSLEPRLISARQQLADVYVKAVDIQKQHERNMMRLDDKSVTASPETTLALLQTELAKVEEDSEKTVDQFASGGGSLDVDSFAQRYVELRRVVHMRRIKVDKLSEQLREPQRRDFVAPTSAVPPIPSRSAPRPPYQPSSTAYPPPPISGAFAGFQQTAPYPPIGATNGWAPYPSGPTPFAVMKQ